MMPPQPQPPRVVPTPMDGEPSANRRVAKCELASSSRRAVWSPPVREDGQARATRAGTAFSIPRRARGPSRSSLRPRGSLARPCSMQDDPNTDMRPSAYE